jgi:uroporphyrinogen-III synthase
MISSPDGDPETPLVLITRPVEDAAGLLAALAELGYRGLVEPMLSIEPVPGATVDLDGCQAILFTSANGARAFAALSERRDLPVVAVGPASAREARALGFADVAVAGGDVAALAATVRETLRPEDGALFHAAGSVTAGDLAGLLAADGYTLRRVPLYGAEPAGRLSEACRAALDENRLTAVTFFSPRTAGVFVRLLQKEGRAPRARTVSAVCLSAAVAEKLAGAGQDDTQDVVWADIRVARAPETHALLAALQDAIGPGVDSDDDRTRAMADDRKASDGAIPDAISPDATNPAETNPEDAAATSDPSQTLDADAVIDAFGGIRPMATKLGVAVSTVQGWKTRNHIPDNRWRDIIAAAGAHDVDLSAAVPDVAAEPESRAAGSPEAEAPESVETDAGTPPIDGDAESAGPWRDAPESSTDPAAERAAETPDEIREDGRAESWEDPPEESRQEPGQEPGEEPDRAARAEPKSEGGGKTALLVAAVALVAVVARPVWAPYVDPLLPGAPASGGITVSSDMVSVSREIADLKASLAALSAGAGDGGGAAPELVSRLGALESRLAALEGELTGIRDIGASLQAIEAESKAALDETRAALQAAVEREEGTRARLVERLGVIESLLAQVTGEAERTAAGLAGLEAVVAGQGDSIATLESRPAVEGAALAGLALSVGDVESALTDGRPFAGALDRLAGLAVGEPEVLGAVNALRAHADRGVPTRATLLADFARAAPGMQAQLSATGGDWVTTLVEGATSLVSIRRKGEAPDTPPVSRAEAALERGDLISAVAALSPVRDGSEAVAAWLEGAEARIAAEADLATLRAAAAAALNPQAAPESDGDGDAS